MGVYLAIDYCIRAPRTFPGTFTTTSTFPLKPKFGVTVPRAWLLGHWLSYQMKIKYKIHVQSMANACEIIIGMWSLDLAISLVPAMANYYFFSEVCMALHGREIYTPICTY